MGSETRTERIPSVRVRPGHRELVDAAAESRGESTTGFTRQAVLEAARRELRQTPGEGRSRGQITIRIPADLEDKDRRALLKAASTLQQVFEHPKDSTEEEHDG